MEPVLYPRDLAALTHGEFKQWMNEAGEKVNCLEDRYMEVMVSYYLGADEFQSWFELRGLEIEARALGYSMAKVRKLFEELKHEMD